MSDFALHMKKTAELVDNTLIAFLKDRILMKEELLYSVVGGGKRFRPALTMIFADGTEEPVTSDVLKAACAVELTHSFSLVHDDLPEMDNDLCRRGKPSCHVKFGHPEALLCGDWLAESAFDMIFSISNGERAILIAKLLAKKAMNMIEGQFLELKSKISCEADIISIHKLKTGALITCAVLSGAYASYGACDVDSLLRYSESLGVLFQIVDDYLDSDEGSGNLVDFMGKEESFKLALNFHKQACEAAVEFKKHTDLMTQAADFLLSRIK